MGDDLVWRVLEDLDVLKYILRCLEDFVVIIFEIVECIEVLVMILECWLGVRYRVG